MTIRREEFELTVTTEDPPRSLVGQDSGNALSADVLICLPGLLETQKSFDPLVMALGERFRIITVDFAGRGRSSPMADRQHYKMSAYLADLGLLMAHVQGRLAISQPHRLHLVGTSMGGLLAMFLARLRPDWFQSLVLNDVSCLLPWTGIMGLMSGLGSATKGVNFFDGVKDLASSLEVDPALIRAVQKPGHLDLPHQTTVFGVDFTEVFQALPQPILLLKAGGSGIIDDQAYERMRQCHQNLEVFEQPEAEHPVPYSAEVCARISQFLRGPAPGLPSSP
jgi:pimeloyl-ACP methyl ester carboxylesterase